MKSKGILFTAFAVFLICVASSPVKAEEEEFKLHEVGPESAQINASGTMSTVSYVITDPQGRKRGYDPRTDELYRDFGSFGSVGYGCEGCGEDHIEIPSYEAHINLIEGTYTIEAIGEEIVIESDKVGTEFYISMSMYNRNNGMYERFSFNGVIDKGLTSTFKFTYNSTDKSKWSGTRVATPSSIKQDITLLRKLDMIDNDGIMTSLLKKVEAIEASIQKGQTKTAKNQLNAFINEIKAQEGKHIDKGLVGMFMYEGHDLVPASSVEGAVKMLIEDAQYIMDNL